MLGTTFMAVPARAIVTTTLVPACLSLSFSTSGTHLERAVMTLAPFSGSRPACAALPTNVTVQYEGPLRLVLSAPLMLDSGTSTALAPRAVSSMSDRVRDEPTSSSPVTRIATPARSWSEETAAKDWMIPAFMSKTPGPVARSPSTANGHRSMVPAGHTVS